MYPRDSTPTGELVLQVYPRGRPGRALVYHGDQEFIRQVLRKVSRRLEADLAGEAEGDLRLLGEDEGGEGEGSGR